MLSLGLQTTAVTADMVRDDRLYHEELAKELAVVLKRLMGDDKGKSGLVSLDEIWCLWNRARGVGVLFYSLIAFSQRRCVSVFSLPFLTRKGTRRQRSSRLGTSPWQRLYFRRTLCPSYTLRP
jgi:EAP30/Vps36 family